MKRLLNVGRRWHRLLKDRKNFINYCVNRSDFKQIYCLTTIHIILIKTKNNVFTQKKLTAQKLLVMFFAKLI